MKTLHEMFPSTLDVGSKLDEGGIEIPSTFRFSNVNIIIGKNGAGKTRFLCALKALYESECVINDIDLIYGYFPGLSDHRIETGTELPEHELLEFLDSPEVRFNDFFKEIEAQSSYFLTHLLDYHSRSQKQKNEKRLEELLEKINSFFFPSTEKRLIWSMRKSVDILDSGITEKAKPNPDGFIIVDANKEVTDFAVAMERFSPGERLLLYISIFFALKRNSGRERIIILDEPETHLHPQALLAFIRSLNDHFPHAIIWIATHSLFLLPEFRFENIVYMENGKVKPRNSSLYETVIATLIGESNERTCRFFASVPHWQYIEFITECFTSPEVVDTVDQEDEQVRLFLTALEERRIRKVLDCGGGSGRLGLSLKAAQVSLDTYAIYDREPSYCGSEFGVYTCLEDITDSYDCVVMMNFLHEVEPDKWPGFFRKMYYHLTPKGSLLFVEVNALKDGECPNETGYLVLGKNEIVSLFNIKDDLPEIHIRDKQKSIGILIPRQFLKNVTVETVSASIKELEIRTYAELKQFRSEEAKRKKDGNEEKSLNARRYAFLTQQYINAKLYNETVHADYPPYVYVMKDKKEKLVAMFEYAMDLSAKDPMVNSKLCGATRSIFSATVDYYKKYEKITNAQHNRCTERIQEMKDAGAQEQTLDAFSEILILIKDNRAGERALSLQSHSSTESWSCGSGLLKDWDSCLLSSFLDQTPS